MKSLKVLGVRGTILASLGISTASPQPLMGTQRVISSGWD